ncbi:glycosyltransferase [Niastella koreensis]|nr:glycosyltransferase [Niastella koreensis]
MFDATGNNYMEISKSDDTRVWVMVPHLRNGLGVIDVMAIQKILLDSMLESIQINKYVLWYYSPMALGWSDHLSPTLIVYDCMDELAAFKFAPPFIVQREQKLMRKADLVFTGGQSLYLAKKHLHNNIHPFPSSIDKVHFSIARTRVTEPADQADIPHPRIGYYGVLDERLDIDLLNQLVALRPDWQFIMIGPVVKIDPADLPAKNNIHYLGSKNYSELPNYLAGWDIAMMPFALNESTRYISPTKTPEYLAGGKPVVSTPIKDVITPYGEKGLVHIAASPAIFVAAAESILTKIGYDEWLEKVDRFLSGISWDKTWQQMNELINRAIEDKRNAEKVKRYV